MERAFDVDFALKAEEAFICGPRCEIMPVVKIDRGFINGGKTGTMVYELQKAFESYVGMECPKR